MTPATPSHAGVRLHIVTGKGGTGKTTVAAALALALARQGKRVLLAEVEERQGISQTFDVPPLGHEETRIVHERGGGELYGMSVDVRESLMEYLQKFYKLGRAGSVLEKVGAVDFATTIAPGLRDVLLIGKVYEAAGRRREQPAARPPGLRRRCPRRAPHRPGGPLPQRQRRGRRRRPRGADPHPGRLDHADAAQPPHRSARGLAARGDAGAGDRRRARGAEEGLAAPSGRSSSTRSTGSPSTAGTSRPSRPTPTGWARPSPPT